MSETFLVMPAQKLVSCSVSYDPITLEYNQDADGETLKYMDDIVKWKVRQKQGRFISLSAFTNH